MKNRKTWKKGLALGLCAVIALSMAACGGSGDSASGAGSTGDPGTTGGKTLRVAIWDNNQLSGLQQIADEWGSENGYDVQFEVLDWSTYWTMLEAGVSGGEMPDVFWMHSDNATKYMGADVLMNLNDFIEEDDAIDLENYYEGIVDLYASDGNQYAIPKDHDTIAVIYNKAIFNKYGVEYPSDDWTWEDYAAAAQEISEKGAADGVYGTYCNVSNDQDTWYDIVYAYGGSIISDDKTKSGLDDPNTIEAMNFVANEILPACPPQDTMASTSGDTMFLSGLIGMECQGSWMVNTYNTADNVSDYGWAMIPYADLNGDGQCQKEERCSIYNGLGWSMSANTQDPEGAWGLISALCSEEGQQKQSELGVTMSGYVGASDAFVDAFDQMDVSPFVKVEQEGTLVFRPVSKNTAKWADNNADLLVDAWTNPANMEADLKQAAADMNEILAEERE